MRTPTTIDRLAPRAKVFSLWKIVLLVLLAIGCAYLLIPKETELVQRLVEDGNHNRALELVEATVTAKDVLAAGGEENAPPEDRPDALLSIMLRKENRTFDESSIQQINTLLKLSEDVASARRQIQDRDRAFSKKAKIEFQKSLAVRALQLGKPELAADVYEDLWKLEPPNLERLEEMVTACRYAGEPRRALEVISSYLDEKHLPFTQLPEGMRHLTVGLHREVNDGSGAFELLCAEFDSEHDPEERRKILELLATTAEESDRVRDSLPLLNRYLSETDAGSSGWKALLDSRRVTHPSDAEFLKYGKLLATNLEWSNHINAAFDIYLKLAALGDEEALDRCVTMYPWIDRQDDVTMLLTAIAPVQSRPDYNLLLARLQGEQGNLEQTETLYLHWLKDNPEDASIWRELGEVLDEQQDFEGAVQAYETAMALEPTMSALHRETARLYTCMGNFDAALEAYRSLSTDLHTRKTLEDYSLLAHSMDEGKDYVHAIELKLALAPQQLPEHFQELSDAWAEAGDFEKSLAVLRDGVRAFPDSASMELALADTHKRLGNLDAALNVLIGRGKPQDKRFADRLVSLAHDTGRFQEVLDFLDVDGVNYQEWSGSERVDLAALYEEAGQTSRALEIYQSTPAGEGDAARMLAERAYAMGDPTAALAHQQRYLALLEEPDPEALMFLGDLYMATGDRTKASDNYRRALDELKNRLASGDLPQEEETATSTATLVTGNAPPAISQP